MKRITWLLKSIEYKFKVIRCAISSDRRYKELKFQKDFGILPDLNNPRRFNEKVICRMLYDNNDIFTLLADKVNARKYIIEKIGHEYLVPLIGVYKSFDEINFRKLPERFAIKCSHDSGSCIVCEDRLNFSVDDAKRKINFFLKRNMYYTTREKHYKKIPPVIICEEYIDVFRGRCRNVTPELFRIHCFSGQAHYIEADFTDSHSGEYVNIYDIYWKRIHVTVGYPALPYEILPPAKLEEILRLSRVLAKDFDYCRLDWFIANEKIYFSEYTFSPCAGRMLFNPTSFDYILGELWH
ncbi:ATP-grasp fold amidoligase family protein [Salmonella enterica]